MHLLDGYIVKQHGGQTTIVESLAQDDQVEPHVHIVGNME